VNGLERGVVIADSLFVDNLTRYRRDALKLVTVTKLGGDEGYVARIPGFRGLLAVGRTRKASIAELEDALVDWIELALRRGTGLPPVRQREIPTLTAA
jgi:predicted RNase H-like HicB family nuclease